jgi:hypothetical protein
MAGHLLNPPSGAGSKKQWRAFLQTLKQLPENETVAYYRERAEKYLAEPDRPEE